MLNLNIFLSFKCLVQTVIITSAKHNTTRKFVNNKYLTVFNNIINITAHNACCLDGLIDMVEQRGIFHIHKIFNTKTRFGFLYTALCKCCSFCFFVNNIVTVIGFLSVLLFVHLGNLNHFKAFCKFICTPVHIGRLIAFTADDKRCSCLVNKDRVYLVNYGKGMLSLHFLCFILHHIVTKIVKSHFVICAVGNIAVIRFFSFIIVFFVNDKPC